MNEKELAIKLEDMVETLLETDELDRYHVETVVDGLETLLSEVKGYL